MGEAAEEHGRIQAETAHSNDLEARDRRLAAREKLELKTQRAIEECENGDGNGVQSKNPPAPPRGQVIEGNFGAK
ncbi:MAG TPA: hypothetical protein VMD07_09615 [Candidatus Acidoferrales bacterium]|nr:hypothetical protein [Candidatus Acidoferrales bacterium]